MAHDALSVQGVRGCHRADVHPEHVHPLRRSSALWPGHLCEDITGVGGGTATHFTLCTSDFDLSKKKK